MSGTGTMRIPAFVFGAFRAGLFFNTVLDFDTERSFTESGEVHIRIQALNAYQALIDLFVKRFTSRLEV